MKKFDIYGIGNALVDMEFEVHPSFFTKMRIEKGLMTLIDEGRHEELLGALKGSRLKRACGGSAANTILAVAQLGGKTFYSCKIANDETGNFYFQDLVESGVTTNLQTEVRQNGTTGKCIVMITPDADRTMNTHLGITETFSVDQLDIDALKNSEWLYIEGYLVTSSTGKKAAIEAHRIARENGVKTALTFSDPGIVSYFKDGFQEIIGEGVDLLFCNQEEAISFTGANDIKNAADQLKKIASGFAITMGDKGAHVFDGKRDIAVITKDVDAIDTNGAGDMFAGCFLYAITSGHSFIGASRLACNAASVLVTQFGPRLSTDKILEVKSGVFGE